MQKFQDVVLDQYGNVVQFASVIIYNHGTLVKPTIYSDNGSTIAANPLTTDDLGRYYYYAAAGRYDHAISGSKITSYTETDVVLQDPADLASTASPTLGDYLVGHIADGTGAVGTTVRARLLETASITDFMTATQRTNIAAGSTVDITTAFDNARAATKKPIFFPYQPGIYKYVGSYVPVAGGIIGEGWGTGANTQYSHLKFSTQTDTTKGCINTRAATQESAFYLIKNIYISAESWDAVTGCLGYGLDLEAPVILDNVYVTGFKKSNIWAHQNVGATSGPYQSRFENVVSNYSGQHGCLVGNGANTMTFINYQGKWNGAPSFLVAPSVAGVYDGFKIDKTADGGAYPAYSPDDCTIIGGDCSYNSQYGWNLNDFNGSFMTPGYAEGNLLNQARTGDFTNSLIVFQRLTGNTAGLTNAQTYGPYFYRNAIFIGGKQVHPLNYYSFIANPAAEDESSGTIQNASSRLIYLSRSTDASHTAYVQQNVAPDGTTATLATETIASIRGGGTYALGIGSGSRHLKVQDGIIKLPDLYYQATATGWTSAKAARFIGSAPPSSSAWAQGDITYNSAAVGGQPFAWYCTVAGTPGTWIPLMLPNLGGNQGNADVSITAGTNAPTQRFETALTVNRTVTLSTTGVWNGAQFRIVRTAAATGAFTLDVGGLKTLAVGQWCDVEYNGSAWMLTAFGSL